MSANFTDDDVGKRVVNANGDEIGMVSAVEHGTARVDPDPGITDSLRAALGWEATDEETYPLQEASVERVTDDEIRLKQDPAVTGTGATEGTGMETGTGTDTEIGTESERTDRDARQDETDTDL